ncbi:unnamed protein product [Ectocarpus sp. 12 AP-2014]
MNMKPPKIPRIASSSLHHLSGSSTFNDPNPPWDRVQESGRKHRRLHTQCVADPQLKRPIAPYSPTAHLFVTTPWQPHRCCTHETTTTDFRIHGYPRTSSV